MARAVKAGCAAPTRKSKRRSAKAQAAENAITPRFVRVSSVDPLVSEILATVENERCGTIIVGGRRSRDWAEYLNVTWPTI